MLNLSVWQARSGERWVVDVISCGTRDRGEEPAASPLQDGVSPPDLPSALSPVTDKRGVLESQLNAVSGMGGSAVGPDPGTHLSLVGVAGVPRGQSTGDRPVGQVSWNNCSKPQPPTSSSGTC